MIIKLLMNEELIEKYKDQVDKYKKEKLYCKKLKLEENKFLDWDEDDNWWITYHTEEKYMLQVDEFLTQMVSK